jgi:8-oxo-dGTP diphosphatase
MPHRPAEPDDWNTKPMPDEHTRIDLDRTFTADELARIRHGLVPQAMEDKWFVYWNEDRLFFHRSWTGFCIYIIDFDVTDDGATMASALVSRDPDQYRETDDARDIEMINFLIDLLLLHRPAGFPTSQDARSDQVLEQWSVVGRAGLGQHPNDPDDGK